jgi:hypothetical protein
MESLEAGKGRGERLNPIVPIPRAIKNQPCMLKNWQRRAETDPQSFPFGLQYLGSLEVIRHLILNRGRVR